MDRRERLRNEVGRLICESLSVKKDERVEALAVKLVAFVGDGCFGMWGAVNPPPSASVDEKARRIAATHCEWCYDVGANPTGCSLFRDMVSAFRAVDAKE